MAKRRKRREEQLDELEAAIDETTEDRGSKKDAPKGSSHAYKSRRRAERMAMVDPFQFPAVRTRRRPRHALVERALQCGRTSPSSGRPARVGRTRHDWMTPD